MKKKEKIIIENKKLLQSLSNSIQMNVWIISKFGMNAIRTPQSLQSIYDLMEKHGIETFRVKEAKSVSFSLDEFRNNLESFKSKSSQFNNENGTNKEQED